MNNTLCWIPANDLTCPFPPVENALENPNGLLAAGGDLSPARLISAYRNGIFPWYSEGEPILWWSPNPRTVIFPAHLKISRSLRRTLRRGEFHVTLDTRFKQVITACAMPRTPDLGTWITPEINHAYCRLHTLGVAHSVEVWKGQVLVGGLYGIAIGRVFFGESMFSHVTDASKVALVYLVRQLERWGYTVIDGQVSSPHLYTLGAEDIPRAAFITLLQKNCVVSEGNRTVLETTVNETEQRLTGLPGTTGMPGRWQLDTGLTP